MAAELLTDETPTVARNPRLVSLTEFERHRSMEQGLTALEADHRERPDVRHPAYPAWLRRTYGLFGPSGRFGPPSTDCELPPQDETDGEPVDAA